MPTQISFVADMVTNNPATVLDLNASPITLAPGIDLSPSDFDKGWTDNPMTDGALLNRSKATNRILHIPLQIVHSTSAGFSDAIEDLGRVLAFDSILRVQFTNSANPVFFRTFGNPKYAAQVKGLITGCLIQYQLVTLDIEAAPNAYGPRVTAGTYTVLNNPAVTGVNPCSFDVTGIAGDQPTPLLLHATSTGVSGTPSGLINKWVHIGMRRRGTPSGYSNVIQVETMSLVNNTTATTDANFSGGSKARVTPGVTTLSVRAGGPFPSNGVSTPEARGTYRVYLRCAKTVAGDVWNVQLKYGVSSVENVANAVMPTPAGLAGPYNIDMGLVPCPIWADPVYHGFSGVRMEAQVPWVTVWAQRVSGSGSLDLDYLYFVPADDLTIIARFPNTDQQYAIDATTEEGGACYAMPGTLDEVIATAAPVQIVGGGGFPEGIPGQTNRIHVMRQVDPAGTVDPLTSTTTWVVYYWPQWRELTRT